MGSKRNMSSHSSARMHSARLSTSRAMGPTESCTVGQGGEEREITQPRGVPGLGPNKGWAGALECEQIGGRKADLEWPWGPTLPRGEAGAKGQTPLLQGTEGTTDLTCYLSIDTALQTTLAG